ncbi:sugar-transfer associated ATP-grasp domain-containing protein [Shewanella fodinae]|uniref:sugar-transfer associated ATP-grasp domain-containing protein n=1 Tax=Shewanella fodinae TaxID=552357 RepID=UPI00167B7CEB|nr:sugar-transfer associated ATP-grasp domain-containing protein [Shewanella fodinae]MCL2906278.1 hypothetical protein [Shewanella fodinae]
MLNAEVMVLHALINRLKRLSMRRHPHGLLSWRYLLPQLASPLMQHRAYWWHSCGTRSRLLWGLWQLYLWLRWLAFSSWRASYRTVQLHGPHVKKQHNMSQWQQFWRVQALALRWCIPPAAAYRFQLYRYPERALEYVYDIEAGAYHRLQSEALGLTKKSLQLLQDKQRLAEKLTPLGITIVDGYPVEFRSTNKLIDTLAGDGKFFVKTRSGNQGIGAFAVTAKDGQLQGKTFAGELLPDSKAVERAWQQLLQLDDALIQPLLTNHPALQTLTSADEAITVRVITQWYEQKLRVFTAFIEVPFQDIQRTVYSVLPITSAGAFARHPVEILDEQVAQRANTLWQHAQAIGLLPFWSQLIEQSMKAHQPFSDVKAIAWDWVLTPQGPTLLEGNTGWGTTMPQLITGPFLSK